jgi:membrane protease YdiL (CAAX protease family)
VTFSRRRLGAAVAVALVAGWNPTVNRLLPPAWYVPANLVMAAGLVAVARQSGATPSELGLSRGRAWAGLRLGVTVAAVVAAGIAVAVAVPGSRRFFADQRLAGVSAAGLAYQVLIRIPLGTVVFEEVAFRGVLLGLLRPGRRGVAGSSALFGLWHILPTLDALAANGLANSPGGRMAAVVGAVTLTGAVGVFFCGLRLRSGSVVAPAVVHAAANSISALAAGVALRTAG